MVTTRSGTSTVPGSTPPATVQSQAPDVAVGEDESLQQIKALNIGDRAHSLGSAPMQGPGETAPLQDAVPKRQGEDRLLKPMPDTIIPCDKLPDGPEPTAVTIEFPPRTELARLEGGVEDAVPRLLVQLSSSDWVEAGTALGDLRRLIAFPPDADAVEPHLPSIVPCVLASVRSLRSSLCRGGIITAGDLVLSYPGPILALVDIGGMAAPTTSLLCSLLLKAGSNEKQFVVVEAVRALMLLVEQCDPEAMLTLLLPYTEHRTPKVRGRASVGLAAAMQRIAAARRTELGLPSQLSVGGRLVTDNTSEARDAAKAILSLVREAFDLLPLPPPAEAAAPALRATEGEAGEGTAPRSPWETYCHAHLTGSAALAVLKAVP